MLKEKMEKVRILAERFEGMDIANQEFIMGYMIGVQQEKKNKQKQRTIRVKKN